MSTETRDRLALRMQPETKRKIEQWYQADNCKSQNEFVEKAVNFYVDCLSAKDSSLLPVAIQCAIDGRLGLLEKNLNARFFEYAVELDMMNGIISDACEFERDELKRRRAQSVQNVKATNGLISLEKRAHFRQEQEWDDEWQD